MAESVVCSKAAQFTADRITNNCGGGGTAAVPPQSVLTGRRSCPLGVKVRMALVRFDNNNNSSSSNKLEVLRSITSSSSLDGQSSSHHLLRSSTTNMMLPKGLKVVSGTMEKPWDSVMLPLAREHAQVAGSTACQETLGVQGMNCLVYPAADILGMLRAQYTDGIYQKFLKCPSSDAATRILDGLYPRSATMKATNKYSCFGTTSCMSAETAESFGSPSGCLDPHQFVTGVRIIYVASADVRDDTMLRVVMVPSSTSSLPLEETKPTAVDSVVVFSRFNQVAMVAEQGGEGVVGQKQQKRTATTPTTTTVFLSSELPLLGVAEEECESAEADLTLLLQHYSSSQKTSDCVANRSNIKRLLAMVQDGRQTLAVQQQQQQQCSSSPTTTSGATAAMATTTTTGVRVNEVVFAAGSTKPVLLKGICESIAATVCDRSDPEILSTVYGGMSKHVAERAIITPLDVRVEYAMGVGNIREMDLYSFKINLHIGFADSPGKSVERSVHATVAVVSLNRAPYVKKVASTSTTSSTRNSSTATVLHMDYPATLGPRLEDLDGRQVANVFPSIIATFKSFVQLGEGIDQLLRKVQTFHCTVIPVNIASDSLRRAIEGSKVASAAGAAATPPHCQSHPPVYTLEWLEGLLLSYAGQMEREQQQLLQAKADAAAPFTEEVAKFRADKHRHQQYLNNNLKNGGSPPPPPAVTSVLSHYMLGLEGKINETRMIQRTVDTMMRICGDKLVIGFDPVNCCWSACEREATEFETSECTTTSTPTPTPTPTPVSRSVYRYVMHPMRKRLNDLNRVKASLASLCDDDDAAPPHQDRNQQQQGTMAHSFHAPRHHHHRSFSSPLQQKSCATAPFLVVKRAELAVATLERLVHPAGRQLSDYFEQGIPSCRTFKLAYSKSPITSAWGVLAATFYIHRACQNSLQRASSSRGGGGVEEQEVVETADDDAGTAAAAAAAALSAIAQQLQSCDRAVADVQKVTLRTEQAVQAVAELTAAHAALSAKLVAIVANDKRCGSLLRIAANDTVLWGLLLLRSDSDREYLHAKFLQQPAIAAAAITTTTTTTPHEEEKDVCDSSVIF